MLGFSEHVWPDTTTLQDSAAAHLILQTLDRLTPKGSKVKHKKEGEELLKRCPGMPKQYDMGTPAFRHRCTQLLQHHAQVLGKAIASKLKAYEEAIAVRTELVSLRIDNHCQWLFFLFVWSRTRWATGKAKGSERMRAREWGQPKGPWNLSVALSGYALCVGCLILLTALLTNPHTAHPVHGETLRQGR